MISNSFPALSGWDLILGIRYRMINNDCIRFVAAGFCLFYINLISAQGPIDRRAVVSRHHISVTKFDSLSSLTVGNGSFAFTLDATGMQSYPEAYAGGVPLGTQTDWAWHRFPNTSGYTFAETLKEQVFNGKKTAYSVQDHEDKRKQEATDYFRSNPHRLHLANVGLEMHHTDGRLVRLTDIQRIDQQLNLWTGAVTSTFMIDRQPVKVITVAHPEKDAVAFRLESPLLESNRIGIRIRIPSPSGLWKDTGNRWIYGANQKSELVFGDEGADINSTIDSSSYQIRMKWNTTASIREIQPHYFIIKPEGKGPFELTVLFTEVSGKEKLPAFRKTQQASALAWEKFWMSGGAIDLAGSQDQRAGELERRIILSQYLTRVQCVSPTPPQETGLTYNSWFGRPHLEMHWWHAVHFALWGRPALMQKSLDWYFKAYTHAENLARRQGYKGVRWQKMTDPWGNETPSSIGSFLVWQQPHVIYMSELLYKINPSRNKLNKYKDLVFSTAAFMADYLAWDSSSQTYCLGPGLIPAQESHDPLTTVNPTFELAYWQWALSVAQRWRSRLGLSEHPEWKKKLDRLAPLPQQDGVYLAARSAPDSYTNPRYLRDHPSVLGALAGIPPSNGLDTSIMNQTLNLILEKWNWPTTWGWDYPMIAMAAFRLNRPEVAIEALLMPVQKNTYLVNGHNYQDQRLTIYRPGNGGLLAAIAMMCAGTEADPSGKAPGFPDNGKWKVRYEKMVRIF